MQVSRRDEAPASNRETESPRTSEWRGHTVQEYPNSGLCELINLITVFTLLAIIKKLGDEGAFSR